MQWPDGSGTIGTHPFPTAPKLGVDPRGDFIVIAEFGEVSDKDYPVRFIRISLGWDTTLLKEVPFPEVPLTDLNVEKIIDDRFASGNESGRITRDRLKTFLK